MDINHAQPKDPVKGVAAILRLAAAEQDAWREMAHSTDPDDVAAG